MYNFTSEQLLNMKVIVLALSWNYNVVPYGVKEHYWCPNLSTGKKSKSSTTHIKVWQVFIALVFGQNSGKVSMLHKQNYHIAPTYQGQGNY